MAKYKQKSSVSSIVIRVLAVVLLIVGVVLIFNKPIGNQMISHNQRTALTGLTRKKLSKIKRKRACMTLRKSNQLA